MLKNDEFLLLVEAAADFNDLRAGRYFVFKAAPSFHPSRLSPRKWACDDNAMDKLCLRNPRTLPPWAQKLRRMLAHFSEGNPPARGSLEHRILAPAIAFARGELQARMRRTRIHPLPSCAIRAFERQIETGLLRIIRPCLELHFSAFEISYRALFGAGGNWQRDQIECAFIGQNGGERLVNLCRNFPAFARLCLEMIDDWISKIVELITRLAADQRAIQNRFFGGRSPGPLRGIRLNISDPHRGGRETMILRFGRGSVVYKPRSGRSETDWFSLLRWVNGRGFTPPLRVLNLLPRTDYCWEEFVEHRSCAGPREVSRYHRRAGGLICLAYLCDATDLHRDNLIAAADHPVLIDTETLFHPASAIGAQLENSVLRTGLLPLPGARATQSIAALGGTAAGKHIPKLRGQVIRTSNHTADVLTGFRAMWNLVGDPRTLEGKAVRRRLDRLSTQPWRRIHCSTRRYVEIRAESLHPSALRSGIQRSHRIARALLRPDANAAILLEEMRAITRCDVPYFFERPAARSPSATFLSRLLNSIRSALAAGTGSAER